MITAVLALRTELIDGPNADRELRFDSDMPLYDQPDGVVYTATPLSFDGYVTLHLPLVREELMRLLREQSRPVAPRGVYGADFPLKWCGFCSPAPWRSYGEAQSNLPSSRIRQ